MNEIALSRLETFGESEQPLEEWGFRFYSQTRLWRKVGTKQRRMPRNARRSQVAEEVGVPEGAIEAWEQRVIESHEGQADSPIQLLELRADGTVNSNPLRKWNFEYFAESQTWRRARASRNEVSRTEVARKVGVSEEAIQLWEAAAVREYRASQT